MAGTGCQWSPRRNAPGSETVRSTIREFVVSPTRVRVKLAVSLSVTLSWSAAMVITGVDPWACAGEAGKAANASTPARHSADSRAASEGREQALTARFIACS